MKDFPDPITVYDDSNEQRAAAVPAVRPASSPPGRYAEFECAAGAPISTANLPSETRDIVENGEAQNVIYYQPAGVTVFGLEARALERFRSVGGNSGVAVYVALDRPSIMRAILARYPDASISGDMVQSPAMSGFISLQAAQNDLVRIACLSRASGGGQ